MDLDMSDEHYKDLREDFRMLVNIPFSFEHLDEEIIAEEFKEIDECLSSIKAEVPGGELLAEAFGLLNKKLNTIINTLEHTGRDITLPENKDISLSVGGVGFSNKMALLPGDTLHLILAFPPMPYTIINTHGSVVRSVEKTDEAGSYFDVAVKFQRISEEERQFITKYLFNAQRRSGR